LLKELPTTRSAQGARRLARWLPPIATLSPFSTDGGSLLPDGSVAAKTMYLGVRAGGGPHVNTPFGWDGWPPYGRGYQTLTEAEAAAARALEDECRAKNPQLQREVDRP
jgi:hypothetical protein